MCYVHTLSDILFVTVRLLGVRAVIFLRQIVLLPERSMTHEVGNEMQFTVDTL